ncbi:hypothetical protein RND71_018304 [Anisodus tanguticus]|uniref:Uncharacterized protein n=1 Tax=Anisodus tanguticus TaxID=243964 RepID=A0AAE1S5F9_9SOLA|nr:hypothetical protein RND71_018304 [Anisodus tanguticus]
MNSTTSETGRKYYLDRQKKVTKNLGRIVERISEINWRLIEIRRQIKILMIDEDISLEILRSPEISTSPWLCLPSPSSDLRDLWPRCLGILTEYPLSFSLSEKLRGYSVRIPRHLGQRSRKSEEGEGRQSQGELASPIIHTNEQNTKTKKTKMWLFKRKGSSGFSSSSTAEEAMSCQRPGYQCSFGPANAKSSQYIDRTIAEAGYNNTMQLKLLLHYTIRTFLSLLVDQMSRNKRSYIGYSSFGAYGESKLANILHANELTRRLKEDGVDITANSLHPGTITTNLFRHMGQMFNVSVKKGVSMRQMKSFFEPQCKNA